MVMRFIVTGGGTGGHIYPAMAIAQGLQERFFQAKILYVGTSKGLEADIVPKAGLDFAKIKVEGLARPFSYRTAVSLLRAVQGGGEALRIVKKFQPHVVIGTGGYVCGPVVVAAALLGVPTLIHEQNAFPGVTNRILARFARRVCITFEDAAQHFPRKAKVALTGLPVRPEILSAERLSGLKALGLSPGRLTVVITGGSRGARSINRVMTEILPNFFQQEDVQFCHVTGQAGYRETTDALKKSGISMEDRGNIKIVPYLYEMHHALAAADIIIGRAGASFLSEVMVRGIPAILIPYPFAAANHQEYNARALERRGAAKVILEKDLTGKNLEETLQAFINNNSMRKQVAESVKGLGKVDALKDIIDIVAGISKER